MINVNLGEPLIFIMHTKNVNQIFCDNTKAYSVSIVTGHNGVHQDGHKRIMEVTRKEPPWTTGSV